MYGGCLLCPLYPLLVSMSSDPASKNQVSKAVTVLSLFVCLLAFFKKKQTRTIINDRYGPRFSRSKHFFFNIGYRWCMHLCTFIAVNVFELKIAVYRRSRVTKVILDCRELHKVLHFTES